MGRAVEASLEVELVFDFSAAAVLPSILSIKLIIDDIPADAITILSLVSGKQTWSYSSSFFATP
jgi:hypothetical protein